ncbi:hypothetical protein HY024_01505 [Candidatus Curtissbacteria bacterium]|nr:hypothetical protein [Candidatus Curtissbacteria bacterium]
MGATVSYGTVKIYDKGKNWFNNEFGTVKQVRDVAYTDDTNTYYGRIVDNVFGYYIDETRGKRDVSEGEKLAHANAIWQKNMLGKNRGVLPQYRLLVKIARDNLAEDSRFSNQLVTSGDWDTDLKKAIHGLDNLESMGHEVHNDATAEYKFARGYAIAEMIEDGTVSFENIEWSKSFANSPTNIKRFHMFDMWADRKGCKKMYGYLQGYLQQPNKEKFEKFMDPDKFLSERETIKHPWAKMTIPGHFELGKHWKQLWGTEYNMSRYEREETIHEAMIKSLIDKKSEHHMMREAMSAKVGIGKVAVTLPGVGAVKWWFGNQEIFKRMTRETVRPSNIFHIIMVFLGAYILGVLKSSKEGAEGK